MTKDQLLNQALAWARRLLAVGIIAWAGWRLTDAWDDAPMPALARSVAPYAAALGASAAALVFLAFLSGLGLRAAQLPQPGPPPPRFWRVWGRVWFQSYLYRYVPGKVMLVLERARLGAPLGVPKATSVLLVVWESLLLLAGSGVFVAVGLFLRPPSPESLSALGPAAALLSRPALGALALASIAGCMLLGPILRAAIGLVPALGRRIPGLILEVSPLAQGALILLYALAWGGLGLSFALTARCFVGGEAVDPILLGFWFVVSYVVGQVASVTPAGIGIRESVLVAGLASGLAGSVGGPTIVAWALANRAILSVAELGLLLLSLTIPVTRSSPSEEPPSNRDVLA